MCLSCRSGLVDYDLGGYSLGGRIVARMLARGATPTRAIVGGTDLEPIIYAAGRGSRYREILANFGTFDPGSIEWQIEQFVTQVGGDPGRAGQRPWHVRRHAAGGAGAGRSSDARRGGRRRRSARLCPGACGLVTRRPLRPCAWRPRQRAHEPRTRGRDRGLPGTPELTARSPLRSRGPASLHLPRPGPDASAE